MSPQLDQSRRLIASGPRFWWYASRTTGGVLATVNFAPAFSVAAATLSGTFSRAGELIVAVPALAPGSAGGQLSSARAAVATTSQPRITEAGRRVMEVGEVGGHGRGLPL